MEKGQMRAPVYEALEKLKKRRVVPFDVPGHKRGRGNPELVELLGEKCVSLDVNSMKPLDNLCHPVSVIKEAEELAAEAFRRSEEHTSELQSLRHLVCRPLFRVWCFLSARQEMKSFYREMFIRV